MTADDTTTDRALRSLDAADRELDESQHERAAVTLERIVATDPTVPATGPASSSGRGRRRRRPSLLLAGGAVAAVAAVVAVPIVTGGDEAFASWSPVPVRLTGAERAVAADACLVVQGGDDGALAFDPGADPSVLVAEARGGWSYVVLTVPGRSQARLRASCLLPDALVAEPVAGQGGFFGSLGGADELDGAVPGRDVVREDSFGVGTIGNDAFVHVEGRAGVDVRSIEVTTPGGQQVQASLDGGRWAAWWPAGEASGTNPELSGGPTYEVTLRDGTRRDEIDTMQ